MNDTGYDVLIIGGGLSGLASGHFLQEQRPDCRFLLLEGSERPGGAIRSFRSRGFLAEWGPHGFLDNCGESRDLIRLAGLEKEVVRAPLGRFVRYICLDGRLRCIPQSPGKILAAPLISPLAKLRVLAEPWKKPLAGEPTVAQWVEHRLGGALLPFADAVFTGTYAGDINRLVMDGVMPGVRALEKEHGSLLRGLLAKGRRKKKDEAGKEPGPRRLPAMTSFAEGMERLPLALAAQLEKTGKIRYRSGVERISRCDGGWQVESAAGVLQCRHLVLALPVNAGLALLRGHGGVAPAPPLAGLAEARLCSVLLGFGKSAVVPFGFGYLAPQQENRFALGALFSSRMFPERAPGGHSLLEVLVGGRHHPDLLELPDEVLCQRALADLRELMHLPDTPVLQQVLRPQGGIPQLEAGYPALLAWRQRLREEMPDLHLCGFGWNGIGINDMVKEARKVVDKILSGASSAEKVAVKGVYF